MMMSCKRKLNPKNLFGTLGAVSNLKECVHEGLSLISSPCWSFRISHQLKLPGLYCCLSTVLTHFSSIRDVSSTKASSFLVEAWIILSASWIVFPWPWTRHVTHRASACSAAQTLLIYGQFSLLQRSKRAAMDGEIKKEERRWNVFYSLVARVSCSGTVSEYCFGSRALLL